jgi:hypothetical protein
LPAVSIAASSDASLKRRGGCLLAQRLDRARLDVLALLEPGQPLIAPRVVLGLGLGGHLLAVDRAPAGLDQHPAARAEDVLGDGRLHAGALEHRVGVEDRQVALCDQVVDLQLVGTHPRQVVLGSRGDDRVVVLDLLVVHHATERKLFERGDELGRLAVLGVVPDELGDRSDLGDHVTGQEARARPRVGQRLVLLVELLRRGQGAAGGESVQRVCVTL